MGLTLYDEIKKLAEQCRIYRNGEYYSFDYEKFGNSVLDIIEKEEN